MLIVTQDKKEIINFESVRSFYYVERERYPQCDNKYWTEEGIYDYPEELEEKYWSVEGKFELDPNDITFLGYYSSEQKAKHALNELLKAYESETNKEPVEYHVDNGMKYCAYLPSKKNVVFHMPKDE